ncbi:hypothetical protein OsI_05256 [Oryza sativa Indica Group]|uniref:Uncharacterized protein n=1 Tax=Oryza sativa subsp. indica TaxID=39946 RepID=A2WZ85_ORYSI|nr:hypothetical protein OsI_05256 [Oryza sativa Indica Group]
MGGEHVGGARAGWDEAGEEEASGWGGPCDGSDGAGAGVVGNHANRRHVQMCSRPLSQSSNCMNASPTVLPLTTLPRPPPSSPSPALLPQRGHDVALSPPPLDEARG